MGETIEQVQIDSAMMPSPPSRPATGSRPASRLGSKAGSRPGTAETGTLSRPGTGSRPGTASNRISCYQCYRQVYADKAHVVEEAATHVARQFCGNTCAERYKEALAARESRERELSELRRANECS